MSALDAIMQGIGNIPIIGGKIQGGYNQIEGQLAMDKAEKNRPVYQVPDEVKKYVEMAQTMSNSDMPGSTQAKQNIEQAAAAGASPLSNPTQTQKLIQNEMNAFNNLNVQQSQYHNQQIQQYQQALKDKARYSDQEFEYNINAPWQRGYNKAINRFEAGQKQQEKATNDEMQIASTLLGGGFNPTSALGGKGQNNNMQNVGGSAGGSADMNIAQYIPIGGFR
jgi:hypothetical protein